MNSKISNILEILKQKEDLFTKDGELLKNKLTEYSIKNDHELIKVLKNNKLTLNMFFEKIEDFYIFKKEDFLNFVNHKEFLPSSYTKFESKIYLIDEYGDKILNNESVSLSFPYKDCLLEFDSTEEKETRKEVFYNETLMKDEIDTLLEPKIFSNIKKVTMEKEFEVDKYNNENLLIKGNNLIALHSLMPKFKGEIKCMYWDVLYNTDNDTVPYNDSFKHSSWLVMMKNRLEIAKELLKKEGFMFIQCDDNEQAYLTILCDEIFGRKNRINIIAVNMSNVSDKKIQHAINGLRYPKTKEFILVYAKDKSKAKLRIPKLKKEQWDKEYNKIIPEWTMEDYKIFDEDYGKVEELNKKIKNYKIYSLTEYCKKNKIELTDEWKLENSYRIFATKPNEALLKKCRNENYKQPINLVLNESKSIKMIISDFNRETKTARIELVSALLNDSIFLSDNWTDINTTGGTAQEGSVNLPKGKKPEKLIKRIIECSTEPNDIVLDAYLGSGTTAAVCHKIERRYIGIEQLDSHVKKSYSRLQNVVMGDQSGISKDVEWKGGGEFIILELKDLGNEFIQKIKTSNDKQLNELYLELKDSPFLSYRIDEEELGKRKKEFGELNVDDKKKILIKMIDKNTIYANYSEIEDDKINSLLKSKEIQFNNTFYDSGDKND